MEGRRYLVPPPGERPRARRVRGPAGVLPHHRAARPAGRPTSRPCRSRTSCSRSSRSSTSRVTDRIDAAALLATHPVAPGRGRRAGRRGDRRRLRRRAAGPRLGLPPHRHRQPGRPAGQPGDQRHRRGRRRPGRRPARQRSRTQPKSVRWRTGPGWASGCSGGRTSTTARRCTDGPAAAPPGNGGRTPDEMTTIFFATDLHGSETCFRKFVAAAGFYGADLLVLGGDLTGKLVDPPGLEAGRGGTRPGARPAAAAGRRPARPSWSASVADVAGSYPARMTPDEQPAPGGQPGRGRRRCSPS